MAIAWPATLPTNVQRDSFSYNPNSGIIRDEMDAGYPKIRRRFTAVTKEMSVSMVMTTEQLTTFETWFTNAPTNGTLPGIAYGSQRFDFPKPIWSAGPGEDESDRPTIEVRMKIEGQPYTARPDGETRDWIVSFVVEEMP
jgi:hypothetical protein